MRRLLLTLVWLGFSTSSISLTASAGVHGYKIIVHPNNPITTVDHDFLRNAYLKKATQWNHGGTIRPVDLAPKFPVHDEFTEGVLKKNPSQLKIYWNQQIFSGKGVPPPEATSPRAVIAYVLANPGAVGYIPVDVDPGGAKVIAVK